MAPKRKPGRPKREHLGEVTTTLSRQRPSKRASSAALDGDVTDENVEPTPNPSRDVDKVAGSRQRNGARGKLVDESLKAAAVSSYDVPDSDDDAEIEEPLSKPKKIDFGKRSKTVKSTKKRGALDAVDELSAAGRAKNDPVSPLKRKLDNGEGKSARPDSIIRRRGEQGLEQPDTVNSADEVTPKKKWQPSHTKVDMAAFPPAVKARIYGGGKGASSKSPSPPKLKGILTPQKRKAGRPPKTVAFDEGDENDGGADNDGNEELDNDQIDEDGNVEVDDNDKNAAENENDVNEDYDNDEEVCIICSNPDSKPPNEIVFCEVCDNGFHQKCYDIQVIPEGDWLCRTCSQEDVLHDTLDITEKKATPSTNIPDIPNFEKHLQSMRRVLLDRCSGNRRIKLCGQDDAYDKAYQLVEQTVLAGEGNSMMVIGGRGCGKTTMIEDVISNLRSRHPDEGFHVIRLNGFIHTDDKLALKEIWRQLGREMDIEDDLVSKTNNYADTMASLLALLSHPTEITGAEEGVTSKSVVFVIDEFELFATHARQTLLYNLFDIAQARKAPIAVLGLTTRIDVVESLEKRVKSRFSHRYVYLSLPKSLPGYWDICRQGLTVDKDELEAEGFDTSLEGLDKFHDYWNEKIEALRRTPAFEDHLEYQYYTTKSVSAFLTSCIQPLCAISISSLDFVVPSLPGIIMSEPQEPRLQLLAALSDLELALLISAARLDIIAHTDTVNFAMAYDEYSAQMGKQRVQTASSGLLALGAGARVWSRSVAVVAWERLVTLGLLLPAGIGGRSNAAHGGLEAKMWKMDVSLEEIPSAVELPGFLTKWCSQI